MHDIPRRNSYDIALGGANETEWRNRITFPAGLAGNLVPQPGGDRVLPAALALEAMAQCAAALADTPRIPQFQDVTFLRPVIIPAGDPAAVSLAARGRGNRLDVAVRGQDQADHIRATLSYGHGQPHQGMRRPDTSGLKVPLNSRAATGPGGQGSRVIGYRRLAARSCVAEISTVPGTTSSAAAVLGDPGIRDAFVQALKGCVPNKTLRPVAVERLFPAGSFGYVASAADAGHVLLYASERHQQGGTHVYDLDVHAPSGALLERWKGLRVVAEPEEAVGGPWPPGLLGPYLERELGAMLPHRVSCVVDHSAGDEDSRRGQTKAAVSRMLGRPAIMWHRRDGGPEVAEAGIAVSAAHRDELMIVVLGQERVVCDVRAVTDRPEPQWQTLLGDDGLAHARRLRQECGESLSAAATRIWGAVECLRRIGLPSAQPVMLTRVREDGWVELSSGPARIASFRARLRGVPVPVVFTAGVVFHDS